MPQKNTGWTALHRYLCHLDEALRRDGKHGRVKLQTAPAFFGRKIFRQEPQNMSIKKEPLPFGYLIHINYHKTCIYRYEDIKWLWPGVRARSNCAAQRGKDQTDGRVCVPLTSARIWGFRLKKFSWETLTHLPVLHKQHADGVLAAEVEYVNVVLNSNLRERLNPRRRDDKRRHRKHNTDNYSSSALQGWTLVVLVDKSPLGILLSQKHTHSRYCSLIFHHTGSGSSRLLFAKEYQRALLTSQ